MKLTMSEADLQRTITDTAGLFGWHWVHIRAVQQRGRWSVPYEGMPGLPDLILAKNGRVILAELKSNRGATTPDQDGWLTAAGASGRLWRPADLPAAIEELRS
jgi:hypothetical protein